MEWQPHSNGLVVPSRGRAFARENVGLLPTRVGLEVPSRGRASTRDNVDLAVRVNALGRSANLRISNLSLGGAFIRHRRPLFVGQRLRVSFLLPGWGVLDAAALVRWTNEAGVGVQFQSLGAGEIWALNVYLKTLLH